MDWRRRLPAGVGHSVQPTISLRLPMPIVNRASRLAAEAYDLAPDDALTLTLSSGALVLLHQLEAADWRLEHALAVDPWLAYGWIRRGWMSAYFGDSDGATPRT